MLTSTVRSSSLASIMRTGMSATLLPSHAAASACSSSVWPGNCTPAAASASLCNGAVTSAAISPRSAARAAQTTHSAAALPAAALTWPHATGWDGAATCSTARQRGGTASACAGDSISATGSSTSRLGLPEQLVAASATSPATKQPSSRPGASRKALAMISGPIPAASPMVMAKGRKRLSSALRSCRIVDLDE